VSLPSSLIDYSTLTKLAPIKSTRHKFFSYVLPWTRVTELSRRFEINWSRSVFEELSCISAPAKKVTRCTAQKAASCRFHANITSQLCFEL
jgi:hypothetical protein